MAEKNNIPAICHLLPDLDAGGIERGTVDITGALVKAGGQVIVMSRGGRMLPDMLRTGARHFTIPVDTRTYWTRALNIWKISRLLKENHIDVLHVQGPGVLNTALLARRFHPCKLAATVYSMNGNNEREDRRYAEALRKCDRVIAVSDYVAEQIRNRVDIDGKKLAVIPRGIDISLFNSAAIKAHRFIELSKKWRLADGIPLIIVPSRLTAARGQALLIKALAGMKDIAFTCLFLGDEDTDPVYRTELEQLITDNGFEGRIRFAGFCDDMPAAYMLADVVVSPTIEPEPFGRVAVEAQAMGRPILAANHGGARETIVDGSTGWLFEPGNTGDLTRVMRMALQMTGDERAKMALRAREHVAARFTLDHMSSRTLDLYKGLSGSKPCYA